MMKHFLTWIEKGKDSDFIQALLNNFIKNHSEIILEEHDLSKIMKEIRETMEEKFRNLEHLINGNLCMA